MLLNQNFLSIKQLQIMNFRLILKRMISPCTLIIFDIKYLNKLTNYSGQPRFKHLTEFAKFLFLIPHGNSYYESIFSTISKIYPDGRHPSTSVYTEKASITNNLLEILIRIFLIGSSVFLVRSLVA